MIGTTVHLHLSWTLDGWVTQPPTLLIFIAATREVRKRKEGRGRGVRDTPPLDDHLRVSFWGSYPKSPAPVSFATRRPSHKKKSGMGRPGQQKHA